MAESGSQTDPRLERRWKRRLLSPQNPFRHRSAPLPPKRRRTGAQEASPPHPIIVIDDDDSPPPATIDVCDSSDTGNHDHQDQTLHDVDRQEQALHDRDDHQEQNFHDHDRVLVGEGRGRELDPEYKLFLDNVKMEGKGNAVLEIHVKDEVNPRIISSEVPSDGSPDGSVTETPNPVTEKVEELTCSAKGKTSGADTRGTCVSDAIGLAVKSEMVANGYCDEFVTQTPNVRRERLDVMEEKNDRLDNGGDGLTRNCEMNVNHMEGSSEIYAEYKCFLDNMMEEAEGYVQENDGVSGGFVTETAKAVTEPCSSKGETLDGDARGTCLSDAFSLAIKSEMVANGYCDEFVTQIPIVRRGSLDVMEEKNDRLDNGGDGDGLPTNCEMNVSVMEGGSEMDAEYKVFLDNMMEEAEGYVQENGVGADGFSAGFVTETPKVVTEPCSSKGKTLDADANGTCVSEAIGLAVKSKMVANECCDGVVTQIPNVRRESLDVMEEMKNGRIGNGDDGLARNYEMNGNAMEGSLETDAEYKIFLAKMMEEVEGYVLESDVDADGFSGGGGYATEAPEVVTEPCCSKGKTLDNDAKSTCVSDVIGLAVKSEMVANGCFDEFVTQTPNVRGERTDVMEEKNDRLDNGGDGLPTNCEMNVMEGSSDMDAEYKVFLDNMMEEAESYMQENGVAADGFSGGCMTETPKGTCVSDAIGLGKCEIVANGYCDGVVTGNPKVGRKSSDVMEKMNGRLDNNGGDGLDRNCEMNVNDGGDDSAKDNCVPNGDGGVGVNSVPDFNGKGKYISLSDSDGCGEAKDDVDANGNAGSEDNRTNDGEANVKNCTEVNADDKDHRAPDVEVDSVSDGDDGKEHCAYGGDEAKDSRASIFGSEYDLDADDMVDRCYKIFLLSLKPDGEIVDFPILKGKMKANLNDHYHQNDDGNNNKKEKSNTDKGLKTRSNSFKNRGNKNSRDRLKFREGLMDVLRKPYDKKELKQLLAEISVRKPVQEHRELRGTTKQYLGDRDGRSYLDHHKDFALVIKSMEEDKPRVLNQLRGFFFWLKNVCHRGVFMPWKDSVCLKMLPETSNQNVSKTLPETSYRSGSKRSRGLEGGNRKKACRENLVPSKTYCKSGIKSM